MIGRLPPPVYLPETADPPHRYRLVVPVQQWVTANARGNWRRWAPAIRQIRHETGYLARSGRLGPFVCAYICAELRFADSRRRDPGNWAPTVKAAVDGLVDARVLPDDDVRHLIGPDIRMGPTVPRGKHGLVLHIWPYEVECAR